VSLYVVIKMLVTLNVFRTTTIKPSGRFRWILFTVNCGVQGMAVLRATKFHSIKDHKRSCSMLKRSWIWAPYYTDVKCNSYFAILLDLAIKLFCIAECFLRVPQETHTRLVTCISSFLPIYSFPLCNSRFFMPAFSCYAGHKTSSFSRNISCLPSSI